MRWQQPNLTAHYAVTVVYVRLNSVVVLPAKSMLWNICKLTAKKSCKSKAMFRIDLRRKIESFSFFIERNLSILLNILRIILFSIELFSAIFRKTNLSKNARLSMESIQIVFWSSRRKFLRFYPPGRNDTLQFREMYLLNAIRFAFKQFQIM